MKRLVFFVVIFTWLVNAQAKESYTISFVDLQHQSGIIYKPRTKGKKASIAFVVMHSHEDYLGFPGAAGLAKRGYTVLTTNPDNDNVMESKLLHIKRAVEWLHKQSNVKKVILLGHSGGATVMTAHEILAEQGRSRLKGLLFTDFFDKISQLPKTDGIVLLDANPGLSTILINSLDPNVTNESTGWSTDSSYSANKERDYMHGQQLR